MGQDIPYQYQPVRVQPPRPAAEVVRVQEVYPGSPEEQIDEDSSDYYTDKED